MRMNRSAPTATVVPILVYPDVGQAVDWLCRTFGFSERLRFARDGVIGHAQLAVGEGAIMLGRHGGPFRSPARKAMRYRATCTSPSRTRISTSRIQGVRRSHLEGACEHAVR